MESKKEFFLECYKLGIIKFGRFTLKSGIESPFYVDLRPLASDPKILKNLANYLLEMLPLDNFDLICGVPYAALPMATAMSLESYIPLIIKRKEAKNYGTKKLIEGIYQKGQNCLLVEDVITSGKSLIDKDSSFNIKRPNLSVGKKTSIFFAKSGDIKIELWPMIDATFSSLVSKSIRLKRFTQLPIAVTSRDEFMPPILPTVAEPQSKRTCRTIFKGSAKARFLRAFISMISAAE